MSRHQNSKNDDCKPRQKKCDRGHGHGHGHGHDGDKKKCGSHNRPWHPPVRSGHGRKCD
jgi:hypothetical protein